MEPEQGHPDHPEASRLTRRRYLRSTGAVAAGVAVGASGASGASAAATGAPVEVDAATFGSDWTTVSVTGDYADPVAVAPALSFDGPHQASPRLRSVDAADFDVRVQEWLYLDEWHCPETAGYAVADVGTAQTSTGTRLEAGRTTTGDYWTDVSFDAAFSAPPVVFASAQTVNGSQPVVTRTRDVTSAGASLRLQEEEAQGYHHDEEIGYLAVEASAGEINGRPFEAGLQGDVNHEWTTISFVDSYDQPAFLADLQTTNGPDTSTVRYRNLTADSVEVKVEEEQSRDDDTWHTSETIGYLIVAGGTGGSSSKSSATGYGPGGYGTTEYGQ